jgi:hypothetical protein
MSVRLRAPGPFEPFAEETISHRQVPVWYHLYRPRSRIRAHSFNPGLGNTRFAPIYALARKSVGTYYAASTPRAAYLESILHDVSLEPPGIVDLEVLGSYRIATITLPDAVRCVSFHTPFLPRLKITRTQLIDSPASCYPETRAWAQAAFNQRRRAQGVAYTSRRDDAARCVMLFEQRFRTKPIIKVLADEPMDVAPRRVEFRALVRSLKLHEI